MISIGYTQPQFEIFFGKPLKKITVVKKGRRFGITRGCAHFLVQRCYEQTINCLWGEVSNGNIDRYYSRYFLPLLRKFPRDTWEWNVQKRELKILDSIIDFRSADIPENWEGFGYHYIVLQEAGIILRNKYLYENTVLPMMMDFHESVLIACGVPKGKRWKGDEHPFYGLYLKCVEKLPDYGLYSYTSYDNPLLSRAEINRMAGLMDDITRSQEIDGEFVNVTDKPFLYAFDQKEHVIKSYEPNPHLQIIISFDFNKDPMTCIVGQQLTYKSLTVFDEFTIYNGSTPELCEQLMAKYKNWIEAGNAQVTGDASGLNRSALTRGGLNHFKIIKDTLGILDRDLLLRRKNLPHIDSRILCNSILQNAEFQISETCKNTIADCIYGAVNDEGQLIKTIDQGLHWIDCLRYLLDAVFPDFINRPHLYE